MPGGTARLRVSGAIARRFGNVIGPSLKGSNSLVRLMSGMSALDDNGGELDIAGICAIPPAKCRMIRSKSEAAQHGWSPTRGLGSRTVLSAPDRTTGDRRRRLGTPRAGAPQIPFAVIQFRNSAGGID